MKYLGIFATLLLLAFPAAAQQPCTTEYESTSATINAASVPSGLLKPITAHVSTGWNTFSSGGKVGNALRSLEKVEHDLRSERIANYPPALAEGILQSVRTLRACISAAPSVSVGIVTVTVTKDGAPASDALLVVDGVEFGTTKPDGTARFELTLGTHEMQATRHGEEWGARQVEVTGAMSTLIELAGGKEPSTQSVATILEVSDGVFASTSSSLTVQLSNGDAAASITELKSVTLTYPGTTSDVTAIFSVTNQGTVAASTLHALNRVFEDKTGPFELRVVAVDRKNAVHRATTSFAIGRHAIAGRLVPSDNVIGPFFIQAHHLATGTRVWAKSADSTSFAFSNLPEGSIEFTTSVPGGGNLDNVTVFVDRSLEVTLKPFSPEDLPNLPKYLVGVGAPTVTANETSHSKAITPTATRRGSRLLVIKVDPDHRPSIYYSRLSSSKPLPSLTESEAAKELASGSADRVAISVEALRAEAVVSRVVQSVARHGGPGRAFQIHVPVDAERLRLTTPAGKFDLLVGAADASSASASDDDAHLREFQPSAIASTDNALNIAIVAEGYTSSQQAQFIADAEKIAQEFRRTSPYANYDKFISFTALFFASRESGADLPVCGDKDRPVTVEVLKDTRFGAKFCEGGLFRILVVDQGEVYSVVASTHRDRDFDEFIIVVNERVDRGGSGPPRMSVVSADPTMAETAVHEFGHSFVQLADEYEPDDPSAVPCKDPYCAPNRSSEGSPSAVKWRGWIKPGGNIGVFPLTTDLYRPAETCKMRTSGAPFCEVCKEAFVLRMYNGGWGSPDGIKLVTAVAPPPSNVVAVQTGTATRFSVSVVQPDPELTIEWYLDGVKIPGARGSTYSYVAAHQGAHTLKVLVSDTTPLVLTENRVPGMAESFEWRLVVGAALDLVSSNGPVNDMVTAARFVTIPQGQKTINLQYRIKSAEFPVRTFEGTKHDDRWFVAAYPVGWKSGEPLYNDHSRTVSQGVRSNSNFRPPAFQTDGTSDWISVNFDVSALTATSSREYALQAGVGDVGDNNNPTSLQAFLTFDSHLPDPCSTTPPPPSCDPCKQIPPAAGCTVGVEIQSIRARPLSELQSPSDSSYYSLPPSGTRNHHIRTMDLKILRRPTSAKVRIIVDLLGADGSVIGPIMDASALSHRVEPIDEVNGEYRVRVTLDSLDSRLPISSPSTHETQYRFTVEVDQNGLKAKDTEIVRTIFSAAPPSTDRITRPLHALWHMPSAFLRFAPTTGVREEGGDDWTSRGAYEWLVNNRNLITAVDDIAGEHARNVGHESHRSGTEFDIQPFYVLGGSDQYISLRTTTWLAFEVDNPDPATQARAREALRDLQNWIRDTRAGLQRLLANDKVQEVRYLDGDVCGSGGPKFSDKLPPLWAAQLLHNGVIRDTTGRVLDAFTGSWAAVPDSRLILGCESRDRVHVALNRCLLGELPPPCTNRRRPLRPSFRVNPEASTAISAGQTATLSCLAEGEEPISYQWYAGESGDTSQLLAERSNVLRVAPSGDAKYWVGAYNGAGYAYSTTAAVTVQQKCIAPEIARQPRSGAIVAGGRFLLSVAVETSLPAQYRWYEGNRGDVTKPLDATTYAFSAAPTTTTTYWVRITTECGSIDSATATVAVTANCSSPVISRSETTISSNGGSITLVAAATGTSPLQYVWFEGYEGDLSKPLGSGETITVAPTVTTRYWFRVSNSCGLAQSETLTVEVCAPAQFTSQPDDLDVVKGSVARLTAQVAGTAPVAVRWFEGSLGDETTPLGEGLQLSFAATRTATYWALSTNACSTQRSRLATVTVLASCVPPEVSRQPSNATVYPGQRHTLALNATGTNLAIQWFQRAPGSPDAPIPGATLASHDIFPAVSTTYWASVQNSCGTVATEAVTVTVNCDPTIFYHPQSSDIAAGGIATLEVIGAIGGSSVLSYAWFERPPGSSHWTALTGATAAQINVAPDVTTEYYVEVSTTCGTAASNVATVTVVQNCTPPQISTDLPPLVEGEAGSIKVVTVGATGSGELLYQWYRSSVDITFWRAIIGATAPELRIEVPSGVTDYYRVDVGNACGLLSSNVVAVKESGVVASAVEISGTLEVAPNGRWSVAGVDLKVDSRTKLKNHPKRGDRVKVLGHRDGNTLNVFWIEKLK